MVICKVYGDSFGHNGRGIAEVSTIDRYKVKSVL